LEARYEGRGGHKNAMRIIHGDCLAFLPSLPDKSIHCCISSPPYFNKRDYQTGKWVGGDPACEHVSDGRYYTMRGASSARPGSVHGGRRTQCQPAEESSLARTWALPMWC
jgi:hypothetical protein